MTLSASTLTATIGEQVEMRLIVRSLEAVDDMRISLPAGDFEVIRRHSQPMIRTTDWRTFEQVHDHRFFQDRGVRSRPGDDRAAGRQNGRSKKSKATPSPSGSVRCSAPTTATSSP